MQVKTIPFSKDLNYAGTLLQRWFETKMDPLLQGFFFWTLSQRSFAWTLFQRSFVWTLFQRSFSWTLFSKVKGVHSLFFLLVKEGILPQHVQRNQKTLPPLFSHHPCLVLLVEMRKISIPSSRAASRMSPLSSMMAWHPLSLQMPLLPVGPVLCSVVKQASSLPNQGCLLICPITLAALFFVAPAAHSHFYPCIQEFGPWQLTSVG